MDKYTRITLLERQLYTIADYLSELHPQGEQLARTLKWQFKEAEREFKEQSE